MGLQGVGYDLATEQQQQQMHHSLFPAHFPSLSLTPAANFPLAFGTELVCYITPCILKGSSLILILLL